MKKKLMAIVAAAAMLVAMVPSMVFADTVATLEVGAGKTYTTLKDAIAAANDLSDVEAVTIKVYGKVDYTDATESLVGAYKTINFIGADDAAEISITRNGYNGYISGENGTKDVTFTDLKLSKPAGGFAGDAGFMNVYFTVYRVKSVSYTNCTFPDGACAQGGTAVYDNCNFANTTSGEYSLWVYADVDCTVKNSKFTGVRGVKMYAEGAAKNSDLSIENTEFTSSVTQKPAIVLTYGESVELNDNKYPETGVFELDKDGSPDGTKINGNDLDEISCVNDDGECGAFVGNDKDGYKIYTSAKDAAEEAESGDSLVILAAPATTTLELNVPDGVYVENNSDNEIKVNGEKVAANGTYGEKPVPPTTPAKPTETPATGDNSNAALLGGMALLAMIAAAVAVFARRKEN